MNQNSFSPLAYSFLSNLLVVLLLASVLIGFVALPTIATAQSTQLTCAEVAGSGGVSARANGLESVTVEAGQTLTIPLTISSSLPYTLKDTSVFVAVYKNNQTIPTAWFTASNDIELKPETETLQNLEWQVPPSFESGDYSLAVYIGQATSDQFLANAIGGFNADASVDVTVTGGSKSGAFVMGTAMVSGTEASFGTAHSFLADAETLELSIDIANTVTEQVAEGTFTLAVYEGTFPNSQKEVLREEASLRLISGVVDTTTYTFGAEADQYVAVGTFENVDGTRSQFILPLARTGTTITTSSAVPHIAMVGVVAPGDGTRTIDGCITYNTFDLEASEVVNEAESVQYRVQLHEFDSAGSKSGSAFFTAEKEIRLGGEAGLTVGFREKIDTLPNQYVLTAELVQNGVIIDSRELRYQCENPFACEQGGRISVKDRATFLGISVLSLIQAMQMVIFAILLIIIAIFVGGVYSLLQSKKNNRTNY